jgi:hypothetical protein
MSLYKPAGGSIVETKVVQKIADLPSPLSMQGDERFIVKEDDGVYAINRKTNTWECVGSVKKVSGRRPEDLAAHLDSKANPHGTNLQQTYETDPHVAVTEKAGELTLEAASPAVKALLRLLSKGGAALKIGADAGKLASPIWINAGKKGQKTPQVAVVDEVGNPVALIDSDGNIELAGAATIRGGFKGKAAFEDELTAAEGVFGAENPEGDGYALELGSGKAKGKTGPVVLSPGRKQKVFVTETGLGVGAEPKAALDVAGNVKFTGFLQADASPDEDKKYVVGSAKRRWKGVFAGTLDLDPSADATVLALKMHAAQTKPVLHVSKQSEGDVLVLDGDGKLGVGAPKPERSLDVRGSGIAIGTPVGKARATLAESKDGEVVLSYNVGTDGLPADSSQVSWAVTPGGRSDYFAVQRRAKGGEWQSLLYVTPSGAMISGGLHVHELQAPTVQADKILSANGSIEFGEKINYKGKDHVFTGKSAAFELEDDSAFEVSVGPRLLLGVHKNAVIGSGSLGAPDAPWSAAHIADELTVGGMSVKAGTIESDTLELSAKKGAVGVRQNLALLDPKFNVVYAKSGRVSIVSDIPEKTIWLDAGKKSYGLHFSNGGAQITGVSDLAVQQLGTKNVVVEGQAIFGAQEKPTAIVTPDGMAVNGSFAVNGLGFQKLEEDVTLSGARTETKLKIPAGVRVEAVVVTVIDDVRGARFWQAGDASSSDRFISATTKLQAGSVVPGLNHCDRGQSVQQADGAIVFAADAPATGKLHVAVYYMQAR